MMTCPLHVPTLLYITSYTASITLTLNSLVVQHLTNPWCTAGSLRNRPIKGPAREGYPTCKWACGCHVMATFHRLSVDPLHMTHNSICTSTNTTTQYTASTCQNCRSALTFTILAVPRNAMTMVFLFQPSKHLVSHDGSQISLKCCKP